MKKSALFICFILLQVLLFAQKTNLYPIKVKDKFGYINSDGKMCIKPIYDVAYRFVDGVASVRYENVCHIINEKGEVIFSAKDFSFLGTFASNDLASFRRRNGGGYINRNFDIVFEFPYIITGEFEDGFACVGIADDGFFHFIDGNGNFVLDIDMDDSAVFVDGYAIVKFKKDDGKFERKIINKKGEFIALPKGYELAAGGIRNGYLQVTKKGSSALWELKTSRLIKAPKGYEFFAFMNDMITVMDKKTNLFGLMDKNNKIILPCKYESVMPLSKDVILFRENEKYGLMKMSGEIIIEPQFFEIGEIIDDMVYFNPRNGYDGGYFRFDGTVFYAKDYFNYYEDK